MKSEFEILKDYCERYCSSIYSLDSETIKETYRSRHFKSYLLNVRIEEFKEQIIIHALSLFKKFKNLFANSK